MVVCVILMGGLVFLSEGFSTDDLFQAIHECGVAQRTAGADVVAQLRFVERAVKQTAPIGDHCPQGSDLDQ